MICASEQSVELFRRAAKVRAILVDVDGVLTKGQIIRTDAGEQVKIFNSLDGFGLRLAKFSGYVIAIISASGSEAIRFRAEEIGFDAIYLGSYSKIEAYRDLKTKFNLDDSQICYVGDDLPDIPLLELVGLPVAVHNSAADLSAITPFQTRRRGGEGAVREVIDFIMFAQGKRDEKVETILKSFGR